MDKPVLVIFQDKFAKCARNTQSKSLSFLHKLKGIECKSFPISLRLFFHVFSVEKKFILSFFVIIITAKINL